MERDSCRLLDRSDSTVVLGGQSMRLNDKQFDACLIVLFVTTVGITMTVPMVIIGQLDSALIGLFLLLAFSPLFYLAYRNYENDQLWTQYIIQLAEKKQKARA